jgi:putative endonuclease
MRCSTMSNVVSVADEAWWLYLLLCRDGRTYVGIALDVDARFELHATGKGSKFTRSNRPVKVLARQAFQSKSDALKAELALKRLNRIERLRWAQREMHSCSRSTEGTYNTEP